MQYPRGLYACSLMMSFMMAALALPACPLKSTIDCFRPRPAQRSLLFYLMVTLTSADDEEIREGLKSRTGDGLITLPLSVNHPQMYACALALTLRSTRIKLTHTHTHTRHISDCFEYYFSQLAPFSLTTWQLNSDWNNVSGIILLLFHSFLGGCVAGRPTGWCHLSPWALLVPLNLSTLNPPAPEWRRDDCQTFKDAQPKVCRGWPLGAAVCVPYPFLHLTVWVQPVHPSRHMQHLAEIMSVASSWCQAR